MSRKFRKRIKIGRCLKHRYFRPCSSAAGGCFVDTLATALDMHQSFWKTGQMSLFKRKSITALFSAAKAGKF
jgi:hypothetical protein